VTRLIARYMASGQVRMQNSRRHRFPQRYTRADIELLAQVDEAHQGLSCPAEFREYGQREFERWPRFPTVTSTTFGATPTIGNDGGFIRRYDPALCPSASAVGPSFCKATRSPI